MLKFIDQRLNRLQTVRATVHSSRCSECVSGVVEPAAEQVLHALRHHWFRWAPQHVD